MASPQTENGFVMIALDLFPAIMSAGLSTYAQVVLAEIVLQSYGPEKDEKVYLSAADLQSRTGVDKSNLRRAMRELEQANIVFVDGDAFTLNKDYETWTPKAGSFAERFEGRMLKWITHSPERHGKHRRRVSKQTQETPSLGVYVDTPEATQVSLDRHPKADVVSLDRHREVIPPTPPIEERAREEELRVENREIRQQQPESVVVGPTTASGEPEYPDPETSPLMVMPGGANTTEAEARQIWSSIWKQWNNQKLCNQFYEHQRWYPAFAWREAIRKVVLQSKTPHAIGYLETIAGEATNKGESAIQSQSTAPSIPTQPGDPAHIPFSQRVQLDFHVSRRRQAEMAAAQEREAV